jgi:hypothetical protein
MEYEPRHEQHEEEIERRPEVEQSPEARRISESIAEALRDGNTIDHETAWLIARSITPGSGPLHELSVTGAISPEIGSDLEVAYEVLPEVADTWIAALDGYCWRRRDKGPVDGWPTDEERETRNAMGSATAKKCAGGYDV